MTNKIITRHLPWLTTALTVLFFAQTSQAHFLWLKVQNATSSQPTLQCYFSEVPTPDDPDLLKLITKSSLWCQPEQGEAVEIKLNLKNESLSSPINATQANSLFFLKHNYGKITRKGKTFELRYYALTGPGLSSSVWKNNLTSRLADLQVLPEMEEGKLIVTVKHKGQVIPKAEVTPLSDLVELKKHTTNQNGQISIDLTETSIDAIRVKIVEQEKTSPEGQTTEEIRHYITMTFPPVSYASLKTTSPYPVIPETVTSFGAATIKDHLFFYGGHTGGAHKYNKDDQAHTLWHLDLNNPEAWKDLGQGPGLQGLAMVAYQEKLYRIGGFKAKNAKGEDHDLWSQNNFSCYDTKTESWKELPSLPEPRSSFDAVVHNGIIYVIGGWSLQGEKDSHWHTTACSYDLNASNGQWKQLPSPPYAKRAISVAAHNNKIYSIGGMKEKGGPTTDVSIFDIQTQTWTSGPNLIGEPMAGFGTSSFEIDGHLYASTLKGTLQRLSEQTNQWEVIGQFSNARFFHRMVPHGSSKLIFLGGANMSSGKFDEVEVLELKDLSNN